MELIKWQDIEHQIDIAKDLKTLSQMHEQLEAIKIMSRQLNDSLKITNKCSKYKSKIEIEIGKRYNDIEDKKDVKSRLPQVNDDSVKQKAQQEIGKSRKTINEYVDLIDIPEEKISKYENDCNEKGLIFTSKGLLNYDKTGKNYSKNNDGKRNESDYYQTPYSITHQLFENHNEFDFNKTVLESACGDGAITKVLNQYFEGVNSYDVEKNFLCENRDFDYVITNPPYSLANDFILKCKKICQDQFALLLPLNYLHGQYRYENIYLDNEFKLKYVYVFTRYPMLSNEIREDGKYNTGMQVYAWYVWNKQYKDEPIIRWINNNCYVLKKPLDNILILL